jgi:GTP cyclohydrolase II
MWELKLMNNKLLETAKKQLLRGTILEIANSATPSGVSAEIAAITLRKKGVEVNNGEILAAYDYLEKKGLADIQYIENKTLGIEKMSVLYISPEGIDVLEGTRTVEGIEI